MPLEYRTKWAMRKGGIFVDRCTFVSQVFQALNYTKRLEIATLTVDSFQTPATIYVELRSGEKFSLKIQETEETF